MNRTISQSTIVLLSSVFFLALLCPLLVQADTLFGPPGNVYASGVDVVYDEYTHVLLPNTSTILYADYGVTPAGSMGMTSTMTIRYNDTSTYVFTTTTTGYHNVTNPYPNLRVDSITWYFLKTSGSGGGYLVVQDFLARNISSTLTIQVNNSVTGEPINGFCSVGTGSGLTNSSCSSVTPVSLLNPSATCYNSKTCEQNIDEAVAGGLRTGFNTTHTFNNGTHTFLWVPWMNSASACGPTNVKSYGNCTGTNMTRTPMVTDEFSETCYGIAASNRTNEIEYCYNTVSLIKSPYGSAPAWVACADYSATGAPVSWTVSSDTASDGTARIGLFLYLASVNPSVTAANQTKYHTLANTLASNHVQYETVTGSWSTAYGTVTRLPTTGRNCANAGITSCVGDYYVGYFMDTINFMLAAYAQTGNSSYQTIAEQYVRAYLSVSLQNDTDGDGFAVAPKLFDYKTTGNLGHQDTTAYVWDDSDAPRDRICDTLRAANISLGGLSGIWTNLTTYCVAKSKSATYSSTTSTLQYSYNGASYTAPSTGFYTNGFGALDHTYLNTSTFDDKLNEAWSHYSWSTHVYDSSSCGNSLTYRGVRPLKALIIGAGLEDDIYQSSTSSCTSGNTSSATIGGITLLLNSPGNGSTTAETSQTLSVTVYNNNVTGGVTTNQWTNVDNDTFSVDEEGWIGGGSVVSGRYNKTGTWGTISKNYGFTTTSVFNISMNFWFDDAGSNDPKFFIGDDTGDDYLLLDGTKPTIAFKHVVDGGGYSTGSCGAETWVDGDNVTVYVNRTSGNWTTYHNTKTCGTFHSTSLADSLGDFLITQAESAIAIDNVVVMNFTSVTTGGSSPEMNVSFFAANGTLIGRTNNVSNGTTVTQSWSTQNSGAYNWQIQVNKTGESRWFGNYTFTVSGSTTLSSVCTTNGSIYYPNIQNGAYTILVYNITSNTYFNQTLTTTISTNNSGNQWANLTAQTYQALISLSAYRLWLNTSIASFTAKNGLWTNTTTSGAMLFPALNGANNFFVNVSGNYTKNVSCAVTTLLTTNACNATDIYDTVLRLGATINGALVNTWTVNVTNKSLSNNALYTLTTTNGTFVLPALLGYQYYTSFNGSPYANTNTTLAPTSVNHYYNFSVRYTQSVNITIKDELTDEYVNETFQVQFIDGVAENFTITNGTGTVALSLPAYYTIRYSAPSYNERERFITIGVQSTQDILLYAINNSISTQVAITVQDTSNRPVTNATVTLLRYFFDCNCYLPVEARSTSYTGQTAVYLQAAEGHYKWSVDYQGVNYFLSATPETVNEDSRTFTIDRGHRYYSSLTQLPGMTTYLTYNQTNGAITYSWSDPSSIVTEGCLDIKYRDGVEYAYYPRTCSSGNIGSIVYVVDDPAETSYYATGTLITNTPFSDHITNNEWFQPLFPDEFGPIGGFFGAGIIITVAMIMSFSPIALVLGTVASAILMAWIGFLSFGFTALAAISALAIGFALFIFRN